MHPVERPRGPRRLIRALLGWCLVLFGVFVFSLAALGEWTDFFRPAPAQSYTGSDRLDANLVRAAHDLKSLLQSVRDESGGRFDQMAAPDKMRLLHDAVCRRFLHSVDAPYTMKSNWIYGILNHAVAPFTSWRQGYFDPDMLLRYSDRAVCSQQSYVLVCLARLANIESRHVALEGHVIMGAWYENNWHMYDPDLEATAAQDPNSDEGSRELSKHPERLEKIYKDKLRPEVLPAIFDRSKITIVAQPPGAYWHWKGYLSIRLEKFVYYLKFILPPLICLAGLLFIRSSRHVGRCRCPMCRSGCCPGCANRLSDGAATSMTRGDSRKEAVAMR